MNNQTRLPLLNGHKKRKKRWISNIIVSFLGGSAATFGLSGVYLEGKVQQLTDQLAAQVEQRLQVVESRVLPLAPTGVFPALSASLPPAGLPAPPAALPALPDWQAEMLSEHNAWRSVVGVPPLTWSPELEKKAEKWAKELAEECELVHSSGDEGENLYKSGPLAWSDGRTEKWVFTPQQIVADWGGESDRYNYQDNTCIGVCGHYTQVIWRATKEVGCAAAECKNKAEITVCKYFPAGNHNGLRPY